LKSDVGYSSINHFEIHTKLNYHYQENFRVNSS